MSEEPAEYKELIEAINAVAKLLNEAGFYSVDIKSNGNAEISTEAPKSSFVFDFPSINKLDESKKFGYIYLLFCPSNGLYKIGRSKNKVEDRYGNIAKQSPVEISLVHSYASKDYLKSEKQLHDMYSHKRQLGEWFSLSEEDVNFICSLRGTP